MSHQIAIDGPAGAGKSTIAKELAKKKGWIYADTGAMYRAMALFFIENDISSDDTEGIDGSVESIAISISFDEEGNQRVILNGEDVSGRIRTEEVSAMTSRISIYQSVRGKLTAIQRELAGSTDLVMDGRDIGTTVLPDATLKIYLTASALERAKRRQKEYAGKGIEADLDELIKDINERDERDMKREISPLRQADDAVLIDSSQLTINEVTDKINELYEQRVRDI